MSNDHTSFASILGPPKSGTTSLANWLAAHPEVLLTNPKENHYFCDDMPDTQRLFRDWRAFERVALAGLKPQHKVVLDASPYSLQSAVAVPNMERRFPGSKYIVILRDPVDAFESLHAQYLWTLKETSRHPFDAWQSNLRNHKVKPGSGSGFPHGMTDYLTTLSFGTQALRVRQMVGERLLVLRFEDLVTRPHDVLETALRFLCVDPTRAPKSLNRMNARKSTRWPSVHSLIWASSRAIPAQVKLEVLRWKSRLGLSAVSLTGALLQTLMKRDPEIQKLDSEQRAFIAESLRDQLAAFETLLDGNAMGLEPPRGHT